jgi:hypothetical protein
MNKLRVATVWLFRVDAISSPPLQAL